MPLCLSRAIPDGACLFANYPMDEYFKKAEVLTKFFGVYGKGNFDLSIEEIGNLLMILDNKKDIRFIEAEIQLIYERLEKQRMD